MTTSYIALNRTVEKRAANDPDYRQQLQQNQKKTLADGRTLSDDQILAKLHSLGLKADRSWMERASREFPSAQSLAEFCVSRLPMMPNGEQDWIWIGLTCLWERWFPGRLNFEMLDDRIDEGYALLREDKTDQAADVWSAAWRGVPNLLRVVDAKNFREFDDRFGGTYSIFMWLDDCWRAIADAGELDQRWALEEVGMCKAIASLATGVEDDEPLRLQFEERLRRLHQAHDGPKGACERGLDDRELAAIVAELNQEPGRPLPTQAIRKAQLRPRMIAPRLVALIDGAVSAVRGGGKPDKNGHFFALFLLTEFRWKEALPAIVEAIKLPGEGPFDLFGDAVTSTLPGVLAALCPDQPSVIGSLIDDEQISEYVRWSCANYYLQLVQDRRLAREQAIGHLIERLSAAINRRDTVVPAQLVDALAELAPREAMSEIERAFNERVVDEGIISLDEVKRRLNEDAPNDKRLLAHTPSVIVDTVLELSSWAGFQDDESRGGLFSTFSMPVEKSAPPPAPRVKPTPPKASVETGAPQVQTVVNRTGRVGRNEPCPCGSGKKFKKCCGARRPGNDGG